ncbi:antifreeze protein type IV [Engraulis encrasicolus]|uniref:antifreeze protein type IV n=1 Tax=Engraulis encrasicolus TaxID=184585 RepID=UPI002FD0C18D
MKFSLTVALVILVILQGTESAPLVKPDLSAEIAKVTQYFQDMSKLFTTTSTELVEKVKAYELTSKAEAYLEEGKALLQQLEKVQEEMKPLAASIEEQLKPLSASLQAHIKPLAASLETQIEDLIKRVVTQTKALLPPQ